MSNQDDVFPDETIAGLEESSQGAFNPADDVSERPQIPLEGGLNLSVSVKSQDSQVLEVEHLFGQSPIFQGLVKEEIRVNVKNQPYGGFMWIDISQQAFQKWENNHDGYGSFEDLEGASLDDVRGFLIFGERRIQYCLSNRFTQCATRQRISSTSHIPIVSSAIT